MAALWIAFKASRAFKPVMWIALIVAALGIAFLIGKCTPDRSGEVTQAEQTNRSGEAAAQAASNAIETLQQRTVTDGAIDKAVDQATKDIDNAQTVDAIHDIVVDSVCGKPAHRNDPACVK